VGEEPEGSLVVELRRSAPVALGTPDMAVASI
jgi:hypothetical protein